jgi:multidrug efflux pump subunit AcrA (membrane-fusion protein)
MKFKAIIVLLVVSFFALSGCGIFAASPTPLPTVVLGTANPNPQATTVPLSGGVTASGNVFPAQQAQLVSAVGGQIDALNVALGEQVKTGQLLVTFAGREKLAAAVEAAKLELLTAQQALGSLNDNIEVARAQAQQNLADAQKALKDAQDNRYRKDLARVTQPTIDQAQANLIIAQDVEKKAQENYDKFATRAEDDVMRAQAFSALAAAQQKVLQAQWNLDWLLSRPDNLEIQQADAAIVVAQANLDHAQIEFEKLKNGPDPDAVALASARIQAAQAQLAASQSALDDLEMKAPFDSTIAAVNFQPGEWVLPGQAILVLADLAHLQVETSDLSERDVPQVEVGQPVTVQIKALGKNVSGRVSEIDALSSSLGGDVVYKTTITLDSIPPGLRAGMSVVVQFNSGQ